MYFIYIYIFGEYISWRQTLPIPHNHEYRLIDGRGRLQLRFWILGDEYGIETCMCAKPTPLLDYTKIIKKETALN